MDTSLLIAVIIGLLIPGISAALVYLFLKGPTKNFHRFIVLGASLAEIDQRVTEKYPGWSWRVSTIGSDGKPVIVLEKGIKNITVTQTELFNK